MLEYYIIYVIIGTKLNINEVCMLSDIEIAQRAKMKDINEIAEMIGLDSGGIEPYGHYKAKISNETLEALKIKMTENLFW